MYVISCNIQHYNTAKLIQNTIKQTKLINFVQTWKKKEKKEICFINAKWNTNKLFVYIVYHNYYILSLNTHVYVGWMISAKLLSTIIEHSYITYNIRKYCGHKLTNNKKPALAFNISEKIEIRPISKSYIAWKFWNYWRSKWKPWQVLSQWWCYRKLI